MTHEAARNLVALIGLAGKAARLVVQVIASLAVTDMVRDT